MARRKIRKEDLRVVAEGNGMDGRIVVTAKGFRKVIPALLFSPEQADTLLRLVDKMEANRMSAAHKNGIQSMYTH
ncbi:MAG: hypothetical protein K2G69_05565 [Muribaculaceae bacterium]|nr:hypothetical protein [Muribaculaceae bacterium]